jgi:hypothetical protein
MMIVPSADLFGDGPWIGEQVIYQEGHEFEASRTRGRVHGFEFVRQCWDELVKAGVNRRIIGREIVAPWLDRVAEWLARDIDPERIHLPPRPDDCLTERQRRMLAQAKRAIAAGDPNKPHAILQSLVGVTRESLEWLWPGRIPLGKLTLLAGDPGLGKSFVTLDIQEQILFLPRTEQGRDAIKETDVRPIVQTLDWRKQRRMWAAFNGKSR